MKKTGNTGQFDPLSLSLLQDVLVNELHQEQLSYLSTYLHNLTVTEHPAR
jgi:hypothetical protein